MIRAVYWDFGGVLVDVDLSRARSAWERFSNVSWRTFERRFFDEGLKQAFDTGRLGTDELVDELKSKVEPNLTAESLDAIWSQVVAARPEVVSLARGLQERVWTGVISNTDPIHADAIRQQLGDFGEHWVLSYEEHALKPDPLIFENALEISPVSASETLFVDDLAENVEAARQLGFVAHRFVSTKALLEELVRLGM